MHPVVISGDRGKIEPRRVEVLPAGGDHNWPGMRIDFAVRPLPPPPGR